MIEEHLLISLVNKKLSNLKSIFQNDVSWFFCSLKNPIKENSKSTSQFNDIIEEESSENKNQLFDLQKTKNQLPNSEYSESNLLDFKSNSEKKKIEQRDEKKNYGDDIEPILAYLEEKIFRKYFEMPETSRKSCLIIKRKISAKKIIYNLLFFVKDEIGFKPKIKVLLLNQDSRDVQLLHATESKNEILQFFFNTD